MTDDYDFVYKYIDLKSGVIILFRHVLSYESPVHILYHFFATGFIVAFFFFLYWYLGILKIDLIAMGCKYIF